MAGYIQTAQRDDWGTPEATFNQVMQVLGHVDLDPCGAPRLLPWVMRTIHLPEDGLAVDWSGLNVFVNPPYGKPLDAWLYKCATEKAHIIALIPACTSRRAWQNHVQGAAAVCFIKGRLRFHGAPSSAGFSSVLVLWTGDKNVVSRFIHLMNKVGHVLVHP